MWGRLAHQFAAIMGFARIFFLDLGFCRCRGIEERFFFFWSMRPIVAVVLSSCYVKAYEMTRRQKSRAVLGLGVRD
jgi:hypothetical protein